MLYKNLLYKLDDELKGELDEVVSVKEYSLRFAKDDVIDDHLLVKSLNAFYQFSTHLKIEWHTNEAIANGQKICGSINILKAEQVLGSWEGIVYFKEHQHYDWMEKFKVVDFFVDEACVGFVQTENNLDYLEYLDFGETETEPLSLTFEGYYQLMMAARGFLYWQRVILHLRKGSGYEHEVNRFKTYMPQIFPDFKWEDFVALYEKLRIK